MKFQINFKIVGPAAPQGTWFPNIENPVECANLESLLAHLATNIPEWQFGLQCHGVMIEQVPIEPDPRAGERRADG